MKTLMQELQSMLTKRVQSAVDSTLKVGKATIANNICGNLIGMTENTAKNAALSAGYKFRINSKDGKKRAASGRQQGRIKVDLVAGRVTKATIG